MIRGIPYVSAILSMVDIILSVSLFLRRPRAESVLIWICSKLENILFYNWSTPYRTVSISTTCWRKFSHFRFAKFCSVLKSIRGDGSLGLGNLLMTSLSVNIGMCPESQISSENSNFGLYHPNNPW